MKVKPTILLRYIVIAAVILIAIFTLTDSGNRMVAENYTDEIKKYRQQKDEFMRTADESPFIEQNTEFSGLKYFPINEEYRVKASVEPLSNGTMLQLATNDGQNVQYREIAILHFDLRGSHQDLTLLQSTDDGHLFLPFYDETSTNTTYGTGRYLDVEYEEGDQRIELDFNKAYNPYCAYVEGYTCPVPPPSNEISIAIQAGEKNYE